MTDKAKHMTQVELAELTKALSIWRCVMDVVTRAVWEQMLSHSRLLLSEAEMQQRLGNANRVAEIWSELAPLNRKIGNKSLLRVRGIDA